MIKGLYAIINIGASAVRMSVIDFKQDRFKEIDYLVKPLPLGIDTFSKKYISLENVKKLVGILNIFKIKLEEYAVKDFSVLSTSGINEANNKDFFIDYIKIHTGIVLQILEPSEEIYIKYVGVRTDVDNFINMEKKGIIFANIASGSITLNITKNNKILFSTTLQSGSLRLRHIFSDIPAIKRYKAYDQYLDNLVRDLHTKIDIHKNIQYLIGGGSSINLLVSLFKPKGDIITRDELAKVYKKIRSYSRNEIIDEFNLREDEAVIVVPTLSIYIHLLDMLGINKLRFSRTHFPITLARYYSGNIIDNNRYKRVRETLLLVARRYKTDIPHVERVAQFALKIFYLLKDLHLLENNEDKILEYTALTHEVGYFVSSNNVASSSYSIIKSLNIPGLDNHTINFISSTAYQMMKRSSEKDINSLTALPVSESLVIRKLASILGIAKALDISKMYLIKDFNINIRDNMIILEAYSSREPFLEILAFDDEKETFLNTFGVPIDIRIKVSYE